MKDSELGLNYENNLPKLRAASSNLVSRSDKKALAMPGSFLISSHRLRLA